MQRRWWTLKFERICRWGIGVPRWLYKELRGKLNNVWWRELFFGNVARPRSMFTMWMGCHEKLFTKDRSCKFGMQIDGGCVFWAEEESMDHLFFECVKTKEIWALILNWLHIPRPRKDGYMKGGGCKLWRKERMLKPGFQRWHLLKPFT